MTFSRYTFRCKLHRQFRDVFDYQSTPSVSTALSRLAHNGEAAWRRRGEHYRLLEPQTVNFPQKVIRSYTPACAKPRVVCQAFVSDNS